MTDIRTGSRIWIPCETKPGLFSGEVMVSSSASWTGWIGFAPQSSVKEARGQHYIGAIVLGVKAKTVCAQPIGEALNRSTARGIMQEARRDPL